MDFAPRTVLVNPRRLGVLANPWHALEDAFALSPFAVLAEDDLIVSFDALEYFTWCDKRYAADPRVVAVTTHQHEAQPGGYATVLPADWTADDRWHFWVWGTWRDRWARLRRDWDFTYEENGGGRGQRGWDWKIRNTLILRDGMKVMAPARSRSQHIGRDGAHTTPGQAQQLASRCFYAGINPKDYQEASDGA